MFIFNYYTNVEISLERKKCFQGFFTDLRAARSRPRWDYPLGLWDSILGFWEFQEIPRGVTPEISRGTSEQPNIS